MNIQDTVYKDFINRVISMFPEGSSGDFEQILNRAREIVMNGLSDEQTLYILKKNKLTIPYLKELLREPAVLLETIKTLALMETANNKTEFEELNNKRRAKQRAPEEQTGFDRILKGIMKVPKPKEEKKEEQEQ